MDSLPFKPANRLEEALISACSDPAARPGFYRLLVESDLFLLTPAAPQSEDRRILETGTDVSFVHWQNAKGPFLPVFSSRQRLQEAVDQIQRTYGYIAVKGRDLFPLLAQNPSAAVLNPGAAYGKELTADEIRRLADGSIGRGERRVVQQATEVLLGQPEKYPSELVTALRTLFARRALVQAAYLAQIHDPASGEPPHLIIGIAGIGDLRTVLQEAGITAQGILGDGEFVDFTQVGSGRGSLESYLTGQTKPFYQAESKKPFWRVW